MFFANSEDNKGLDRKKLHKNHKTLFEKAKELAGKCNLKFIFPTTSLIDNNIKKLKSYNQSVQLGSNTYKAKLPDDPEKQKK